MGRNTYLFVPEQKAQIERLKGEYKDVFGKRPGGRMTNDVKWLWTTLNTLFIQQPPINYTRRVACSRVAC
jgi:hypothetical protein